MKETCTRLLAGALWLVAVQVHAELTGRSEAGYVMARGNAETDTANAKLELIQDYGRWKHTFGLAGLYGSTSDNVTAQRWDTRWQTDHKFSDRMYWFGGFRYEDDEFSGFDFQGIVTTGLGRRFIDSLNTKFSVQIGAGYRRLRSEQLIRNDTGYVIDRVLGEADSDFVGNMGVDFEHAFNSSTTLINKLVVETGSRNTLTQNQLSLQVKMNEVLALALGFNVRNNSDPPNNLERTDTLTTVNLVYELR